MGFNARGERLIPATPLGRSLASLSADTAREHTVVLRVLRRDGTAVEGVLRGVAPEQIVLVVPNQLRPVEIATNDIHTIERRTPHRVREWTIAGIAIIATTAILISTTWLQWPGPGVDVFSPFMLLYVAVAAIAPFILARTPLGQWLTQWRTVYRSSNV